MPRTSKWGRKAYHPASTFICMRHKDTLKPCWIFSHAFNLNCMQGDSSHDDFIKSQIQRHGLNISFNVIKCHKESWWLQSHCVMKVI